jgi:hypothetical protein
LLIAQQAGVQAYEIQLDQQPLFLWKEILDLLANRRGVEPLVQLAVKQNPKSPKVDVLRKLLAGEPILSQRTSVVVDDQIGDREALLFHDDLTLSTGRIAWLIEVLEKLRAIAPAICRLGCRFGAASGYGTGFRIGRDLLLTNWHVLHNPERDMRANSVVAQFDYELDGTDRPRPGLTIDCAIASIVVGDAEADWGIIRTSSPIPDSIPIIPLSGAVRPEPQTRAFILQHPNGDYKRLGYARNVITDVEGDAYLYYLTDTQAGSSGSPVFDEQCRLIGLHHWGGSPQEVAGRPPLKKNRGVQMSLIRAGLAKAQVDAP